jgi:hypothetical protein
MPIDTLTINTAPIAGQEPGTSGLRRKAREFEAGNYLPNYVQSVFDACGDLAGKTIVLGGDGRYFNSVAIQVILKMAAANGIAKVYVAKDGVLATPAASAVIRKRKAHGASATCDSAAARSAALRTAAGARASVARHAFRPPCATPQLTTPGSARACACWLSWLSWLAQAVSY